MKRILEHLRALVFWTVDLTKGGGVKRHYKEVRGSIAGGINPRNDQQLDRLLKHAVASTRFYSRHQRYASLSDFPVINKNTIRSNFDEFISNAFDARHVVSVVTSGSTGTPFKVLHDANKRNRNSADTIYFAERAGFKVGDKLLYLKIWSKNNTRSKLKFFSQNIVPIDVITFNDPEIGRLIRELERDHSTMGFLGYASALEQICRYLDRNPNFRIRGRVNSVIAMSESLSPYTKAGFKKHFGVPALSRYSNLENGIIAQQCTDTDSRFLVNTASYRVEIFDIGSDRILPDGQLGRIVVTDLYNFGMPMIRYDTGDIGAISTASDDRGNLYLDRVEGRKLDLLFATDGTLVSSYIVYKNMWKYTEINQYQLIQETERKYTFKINVSEPFKRELELINEFKEYLGDDADFRVEYVQEIPLLSSGKRKKIVNKFHSGTTSPGVPADELSSTEK